MPSPPFDAMLLIGILRLRLMLPLSPRYALTHFAVFATFDADDYAADDLRATHAAAMSLIHCSMLLITRATPCHAVSLFILRRRLFFMPFFAAMPLFLCCYVACCYTLHFACFATDISYAAYATPMLFFRLSLRHADYAIYADRC